MCLALQPRLGCSAFSDRQRLVQDVGNIRTAGLFDLSANGSDQAREPFGVFGIAICGENEPRRQGFIVNHASRLTRRAARIFIK